MKNNKNPKQISMFSRSTDRIENKWYFPTNRANLLSILAGGIIAPAGCYKKYYDDLLKATGGYIPLFQDGLYSSLEQLVTGGVDTRFPVILEVDLKLFRNVQTKYIDSEGAVNSGDLKGLDKENVIFIKGVIPVSSVTKVIFKSEDHLDDFYDREFDNVPLKSIPTNVDNSLFSCNNPKNINAIIDALNEEKASDVSYGKIYREADSYAGSLAMLLASLPSQALWIQRVIDIFNFKQKDSPGLNHDLCPSWFPQMCTILLGKKSQSDCESNVGCQLFKYAINILKDTEPSDGWKPRSILNRIANSINSHQLSSKQEEEVNVWETATKEILENIRTVSSLEDTESPEKRAILLSLLRPNPEDILKSRFSSLKPGDSVLVLASLLSGTYKGFERLSNQYKEQSYPILTYLKAKKMSFALGEDEKSFLPDIPEVVVGKTQDEGMAVKYTLKISDYTLLEKIVEGDLYLRMVKDRAEKAGYKMDYSAEFDRLSYRFQLPGDRQQKVFVSRVMDNKYGEAMVRFWSPCMDLSKAAGRRKLTKKRLELLMALNCSDIQNCRFGISDKEKAVIVLVDQIVETMDQKELKAHLEHVSSVADEYEKSINEDKY